MTRASWLTIAQGILIFGQVVNGDLATIHASALVALLVGAGIAALQFVVHQFTLETEPPK